MVVFVWAGAGAVHAGTIAFAWLGGIFYSAARQRNVCTDGIQSLKHEL